MKITTQAIADLAGVSRATVDKVIHNRPGVSDAVREKIKAIIIETNYQPVHLRKYMREEKKQIRIAVIIPELQDDFMNSLKAGMDTSYLEFQPYGLHVDYYHCANYEPQQLIAILKHFKELPIDGIALRGLRNKHITELISDFADMNIPVFTYDADLPNSRRVSFIGEDLYRTGQISASLLCKSIGYEGEIALLTGSMNVNSCIQRIEGFTAYLKEHAPAVRIVAIEETLSQHVITYQKTAAILKSYPNLKGMWNCVCFSEDMAQAVIDAGKQKKVKLVSLIFAPKVMHYVKEGVIDYTIGLTPYKLGKIVIKSLYEYLISNIAPPPVNIRTPIYIGTDANIDMFENEHLKDF
ncbi:LacI family DNA-binding transcriptional regulator [Ruminococcus gauvreauii]|uniref:LacI family DNA-binding transcriptional regulator n=1 Tax=Ruminococcus gauvreauii TaxID=438033 RepID=A0ABY5VEA8_9FIRM|nr:LacI family DNA-binding transcriptional regulator [Ruminococcus gauvreauii]UWP58885.1 LacI family DNA-binding transcriptional regulator [Ruminococcus gauvreauii]